MNISFINYFPKIELDDDQTHHSIEYFINPLSKFFEKNGYVVNQFNISELDIQPCVGCSDDPFFIPMDSCRQEDDMNQLYPILNSSEFWFFNIAMNSKLLPKQLCNFLDRLEPLFDKDASEILSSNNGHPKESKGYIYLLATSEYWSKDIFQDLIQEIQTVAFLFNRQYLGDLLRPHLGVYVQKYIFENLLSFNQSIEKLGDSILNKSSELTKNGIDLMKYVIEKEDFEKKFAKIV